MKNDFDNNLFIRVVTSILMIFIGLIIAINFLCSSTRLSITKEIIICLLILLVLCIYDKYDNFSFGKILTMKKELARETKAKEKLEEDKQNLLKMLITVNNKNDNLNKINQNFILKSGFSNPELEQEKNEELEESFIKEESAYTKKMNDKSEKRICKRISISEILKLKKLIIEKYNKNNLDNIDYEITIKQNKNDMIANHSISFDAYSKMNDISTFFSLKIGIGVKNIERLNYELSMLKSYGEATNEKTKLILLFLIPDKKLTEYIYGYARNNDLRERIISRIEEEYSPAINNNLLEIKEIEVKYDEFQEYLKREQNNKKN